MQQEKRTTSSTVDELLRRLTSGSKSRNVEPSDASAILRNPRNETYFKPPPVPPKPRRNISEGSQSNIISNNHRNDSSLLDRHGSSKLDTTATGDPLVTDATTGFLSSSLGGLNLGLSNSRKYDFTRKYHADQPQVLDNDTSGGNYDNYRYLAQRSSSSSMDKTTPQLNAIKFLHSEKQHNDKSSVHESTTVTGLRATDVEQSFQQRPMFDCHGDDEKSEYFSSSKPIVTESLGEANTNNNNTGDDLIVRPIKARNPASTVEILEIPLKYGTQENCPSNIVRSHEKQQLFYENNSYHDPLITPATDDEDDEETGDAALPDEMEVDSMINEPSLDRPPRTSTPNTRSYKTPIIEEELLSNTTGSKDKLQHRPYRENNQLCSGDRLDEDLANISRETDEFNTSGLNQSGGCELVGVNEASDRSTNLKDSPRIAADKTKSSPYIVQFNDSTMHSLNSPSAIASNKTKTQEYGCQSSVCKERVQSLQVEIDKLNKSVEVLNSTVTSLMLKFENLEADHKKHIDECEQRLRRDTSATPSNGDLNSKRRLSQSTTTLNKARGGLQNSTTFSRTNTSTTSRNPNGSAHLASSTTGRPSLGNNSLSGTYNRSLKKNYTHASTNSLYGDISPTQTLCRSSSPGYASSLQRGRDTGDFASMLSLSSINSTLKKSSAVVGSMSNLSQVESQLSSWPSMSSFATAKHKAKDIIYSEDDRLIRMMLYNRLITIRVPDWAGSGFDLSKIVEPPPIRLKLDWVHGYRGRDCRSNIFYLPTGESVYFVASIVVLYHLKNKTQRHYLGHTDCIKCLAVHPNKLIIASGQSASPNKRDKRPIVRVWNTVSLATLKVIGFNEDFDRAICCVAFSKHDQGTTLVVVDESTDHTITLLDWQRDKNWRLAEANSGHEAVLAIDFHPIDKYSLVTVGKSSINFWDVRGMTLTKRAGLFDKYDRPKYVLCLAFNDYGDTITGDSNGSVIIWPRGSNRPGRVISKTHEGGVFSILVMKNGTYLTGGRDRRIVEWDEDFNRTGRELELPEHCGGVRFITNANGSSVLVGTLRNSILVGSLDKNFNIVMQGHAEATSSLAIHPRNREMYLTGGFDDQVHLFSSESHEVLWSKCLGTPATAASFSSDGKLLIVGSTLGKWLVLDTNTLEILFTTTDGNGTMSCIKFSPDGKYFAMGSSDMHIYMYQVTEEGNKFCRTGTCVGHSAPVKEIDWSEDCRYIQSQSMNFELMFWKTSNCRLIEDLELIQDLSWFTHNCTLGFNVIGVWSDSIDSAMVNHCDKSNGGDLLVSVTDNGNINLFRWPACYDQCLSQKYHGNVEKFNFIRFLPNDSKIIAVGAKNCVTTEWIVEKEKH